MPTLSLKHCSIVNANGFINAYKTIIGTDTNKPIQDLFKINDNTYLGGWAIPFPDFMLLGCFPGATKCVFTFGAENDKLTLLLSLASEKKMVRFPTETADKLISIESRSYQLLEKLEIGTAKDIRSQMPSWNSVYPGAKNIARSLAGQWIDNWHLLTSESPITASFCMVDMIDSTHPISPAAFRLPLEKYILSLDEMLDSLHLGEFPAETCELVVLLVNHKYNPENAAPPNTTIFNDGNITDTIGIMCGVVNTWQPTPGEIKRHLISSFCDLSAPCPPTCYQVMPSGS